MTNTTTQQAVERLLRIMARRDSISASTAAEILGEGDDEARYLVREVADGALFSWSHAPATGTSARIKNHRTGIERELPMVTENTDPRDVLIECAAVLWLLCLTEVSRETNTQPPPKELVEARYRKLLPGRSTEQSAPARHTWHIKKPQRVTGYNRPLLALLGDAHRNGRPIPSAYDVLDSWQANQPAEVAKVLADGFDYYNAQGGTKTATTKALQKAIRRLVAE